MSDSNSTEFDSIFKRLRSEILDSADKEFKGLKAEIIASADKELMDELKALKLKKYIFRTLILWVTIFTAVISITSWSYIKIEADKIAKRQINNIIVEKLEEQTKKSESQIVTYMSEKQKLINKQMRTLFSNIRVQIDDKINNLIFEARNQMKSDISDLTAETQEKLYDLNEAKKDLTEANKLFAEIFKKGKSEILLKSKNIPFGWTFFAEKYGAKKRFRSQHLRVVVQAEGKLRSSDSFPEVGDIVKLTGVETQAIRETYPKRGKLGRKVGVINIGDVVIVNSVRQIPDSKGNKEVWVQVEPIKES